MLKKKAVIPVRMCRTLGFYSRLFLVPKPGKKWRPVIDRSVLNKLLLVPTFKMETAEVIRNANCKGEWVVSIDLTDMYCHIPIHEKSQHLLRFHVAGQICLMVWCLMAFCHPRAILLRARHIQGCLNVIADSLSLRDKNIQTEWSLQPKIFQMICQIWRRPMVDMFVTKMNNKLENLRIKLNFSKIISYLVDRCNSPAPSRSRQTLEKNVLSWALAWTGSVVFTRQVSLDTQLLYCACARMRTSSFCCLPKNVPLI